MRAAGARDAPHQRRVGRRVVVHNVDVRVRRLGLLQLGVLARLDGLAIAASARREAAHVLALGLDGLEVHARALCVALRRGGLDLGDGGGVRDAPHLPCLGVRHDDGVVDAEGREALRRGGDVAQHARKVLLSHVGVVRLERLADLVLHFGVRRHDQDTARDLVDAVARVQHGLVAEFEFGAEREHDGVFAVAPARVHRHRRGLVDDKEPVIVQKQRYRKGTRHDGRLVPVDLVIDLLVVHEGVVAGGGLAVDKNAALGDAVEVVLAVVVRELGTEHLDERTPQPPALDIDGEGVRVRLDVPQHSVLGRVEALG
eukprot:PhM_4_TR2259/c0_g1_i1/m.78372